jgi:hypothetical protein
MRSNETIIPTLQSQDFNGSDNDINHIEIVGLVHIIQLLVTTTGIICW